MDAFARQLYKLTIKMDHTFESAFERLEQILEKMNTGKTPLDESLKLFEEADQLIRLCSQRLTSAEQKVETLIKNRTNELVLDEVAKTKNTAIFALCTKSDLFMSGMLYRISQPSDLKSLSIKELEFLAQEIRERIIEVMSVNGGHLTSNLGIVELTIALHRVFDSPARSADLRCRAINAIPTNC